MDDEAYSTATMLPWWRRIFSALWWRMHWAWFIPGRPVPSVQIFQLEIPDDSETARLLVQKRRQ